MTLEEMQQEMIRAIDARCKDNITEEFINQVTLKEKKIMQEMIDTCPQDRKEILEDYLLKMKVISLHLSNLQKMNSAQK